MRTTDNLGGITAFVTTAQLGSFTAAAERLGLTKSAVGKSVGRQRRAWDSSCFTAPRGG